MKKLATIMLVLLILAQGSALAEQGGQHIGTQTYNQSRAQDTEETNTLSWYQQQAEAGDAEAQYQLGAAV